jgi:hypothetical protein
VGNPRPILAKRMWIGIVLGLLSQLVTICVVPLVGVYALSGTSLADQSGATSIVFRIAELVAFLLVVVIGIYQLVRGDRGLGLGLLIGWGGGLVIFGGVFVLAIVALGSALNSG